MFVARRLPGQPGADRRTRMKGQGDGTAGCGRRRVGRCGLPVARRASARGRVAEPPGQDRRCLRAGRQRRPVRSPDGGGAFGRAQAAVLRREPAGQQRRHRIGAGRTCGARRLHPADRRLRAASHRPGDQPEYRLRAAQGLHTPGRSIRRWVSDRSPNSSRWRRTAKSRSRRRRPARARSGIC